MKRIVPVAVFAVLLAACGSGEPRPAATEPAPSAPAATADAAKPADAATEAAKPAEATKPADAATTTPAATGSAPAATADAGKPEAAKPVADEVLPDIVAAVITVPAGEINVELFHKTAPISVKNFVKLARSGFYDGLAFHRVEPGFVAQGGDPNTREGATGTPGTGGPGYTIPAEIGPGNPEKHLAGTLGMADSGLNTAGSQYYFTLAATPHLDGRYTVFGRVKSEKDLEVVRQIKKGDRFSVVIKDGAKK